MLHQFLNSAIEDLKSLVEISKLDINDIKEANHEVIFSRLETKNNTLLSFEHNKDLAHKEMINVMNENPSKEIKELFDQKAEVLIEEMSKQLQILRDLNKNYAKSVIAVYEFYNSLLENIIPSQRDGYSNKSYSKIDVLRIEA